MFVFVGHLGRDLNLCVRLAVMSEWFRIHVSNIQGNVTVTVGCDDMK